MQPIVCLVSYINVRMNWAIPGMMKKDQHGHYVLTNVGTLGMSQAFAPLCPPMGVLGLSCVGKTRKAPLMIEGHSEPQIQDVMTLTNTGDHRYGDAAIFMPL